MDKTLFVRIIGAPMFKVDDGLFSTSSKKGDALLAYLAVSGTTSLTREAAAGLLWSESSEAHARMSLRQVIRSIRVKFDRVGYGHFHADKRSVELRDNGILSDAQLLLDTIEQSAVPPATSLHGLRHSHNILAGCDEFDANFTDWLRVQRQLWSDRFMEALSGKFAETRGVPGVGDKWAHALLSFDPSNEPAARHLMVARAAEGDFTGAIAVYDALWNTLADEFDTEPSEETQEIIADIKLGKPVSPRVAGGSVSVKDISECPILVIAPISQEAAGGTSLAYLEGLRSELISRLVRFREWSVVDWTGNQQGSRRPTYSVQLSAWREERAVANSLNLRDDRTGAFVWGQTVRQEEGELPFQQQDFLREFAFAVHIELSADQIRKADVSNSLSPGLFDAWNHAQQLMYKWRDADDGKALELLRFIIERAPNFGPAHSAMAQFANGRHIVCPGLFHQRANAEFALKHAQTAKTLDPLDARAHLCLGWSQALLGAFEEARDAFTSAIQLNPNDPWVLVSGLHGQAFCRKNGTGDVETEQIFYLDISLAPEHWSFLAGIRYLFGDFEGCLAAARRAGEGYYGMRAWTISALSELGRQDEAREVAGKLYLDLERDWFGQAPPTPELAGDWLAHMFPIRNSDLRQRLRRWLADAGL
ncbi:BTAD domain-containing putative transcriptional regulator [Roseibium sp. M-1]